MTNIRKSKYNRQEYKSNKHTEQHVMVLNQKTESNHARPINYNEDNDYKTLSTNAFSSAKSEQ